MPCSRHRVVNTCASRNATPARIALWSVPQYTGVAVASALPAGSRRLQQKRGRHNGPIRKFWRLMETQEKVILTPEQETLLIPLYCKARPDNPLFDDSKARDVLAHLDYHPEALRIPSKTCVMMCLRAFQLDAYVREFISAHDDAVVVHLGCGLDSRCLRVKHDGIRWYDLDMPAVIDLRRRFYTESDDYRLIASSVTDLDWVRLVAAGTSPVLVMAEGLLMYLSDDDVKRLVLSLTNAYPGCHLVFDAFSRLTARKVKAHPSIQSTGARVLWGIDDPRDLERWHTSIRLVEERYFSQFVGVERLNAGYRLALRLSALVPAARRAHRILCYTL